MTTQTYSESQGHARFDWRAWLEAAMKQEPEHGDHLNANDLARSWVTCACGNECAVIPRGEIGEPMDHQLMVLGAEFAWAIEDGQWNAAALHLAQIEARSAELIAEIEGRK